MNINCATCGIEWPKGGPRQKYCSPCGLSEKRRQDRRYYSGHSEHIRAHVAAWAVANREHVRQRNKAKREANAEQIKRRKAEDYAKSPEQAKKRASDWYARNREKVRQRNTSPEGRAAAVRREMKKRESPHYRLHSNVAGSIWASLRERKAGRKWESLVGYSLACLVRHLERQFLPGMSWDNLGKWHLDHILPRKSFTFISAEDAEFKACWALTNLRPLWALDNIRKHAKRVTLL